MERALARVTLKFPSTQNDFMTYGRPGKVLKSDTLSHVLLSSVGEKLEYFPRQIPELSNPPPGHKQTRGPSLSITIWFETVGLLCSAEDRAILAPE